MAVEPAWGSETGTIAYDYDLIYQLTGAEGPGFPTYPDASFTYDSMGNRVEAVFAGQTDNYTSNELNQYTKVSSTGYQYDLNGNLTDDGNQLYEYDWENRLTAVRRKSDNALIAEYRYDPFGRRAKKIVRIPQERMVSYLYDGAQVIEERDNDFDPERRFVYGPGIDEPISIHNVISGETYFYQRDGLGSVTELTDAEGNVIERYRYSPYGKLKIYDGSWTQLTGSAVGNPYFFTGRRYDPESGLYYYRARMYSSEVGRFLQPDPIGYWDGLNRYTYVLNNPLNLVDPLGLQSSQEEIDRQERVDRAVQDYLKYGSPEIKRGIEWFQSKWVGGSIRYNPELRTKGQISGIGPVIEVGPSSWDKCPSGTDVEVTIAHEIGHYMQHRRIPLLKDIDDTEGAIEDWAKKQAEIMRKNRAMSK